MVSANTKIKKRVFMVPVVTPEYGRNSKIIWLKMDVSLLARFSALYEIKFNGFEGLQT